MIHSLARPYLINTIHDKLSKQQLPGNAAHIDMAHTIRKGGYAINTEVRREAGVLITLFEKDPGNFHLIFVKRGSGGDHDKHAGQIAFPGGKKEPGDHDLMYTAMREAEEEISLDLSSIDILGGLTPLHITVSKYLVFPFVAYSWKRPHLTKQEAEIEEIIELPLSEFKGERVMQKIQIHLADGILLNHVPCFAVRGHIIWGATAMIMNELLEILR